MKVVMEFLAEHEREARALLADLRERAAAAGVTFTPDESMRLVALAIVEAERPVESDDR